MAIGRAYPRHGEAFFEHSVFASIAMTELDQRTIANMDVVLERVCQGLPSGGDHATRKYVAQKLIQYAKKGNTTLGSLELVGRRALQEITQRTTSPRAQQERELGRAKSQLSSGQRLH